MTSFTFRPTAVTDQVALVNLPWHVPLNQWPNQSPIALGEHRHVVRFIRISNDYVVCKELPDELVFREYRLLTSLRERSLPVVTLIGGATGRLDEFGRPLGGVLMTRMLGYALPYRRLFSGPSSHMLRVRLVDALALLVTRLHLAGFFWGDCSLNNALFRRDAGALRAYVVDTETGELHKTLSTGQRMFDISIAVENVAGGLLDLQGAGVLPLDVDPFQVATDFEKRCHDLWEQVTRTDEIVGGDLWRVQSRIEQLNHLGFDAEEMEVRLESDGHIRVRPTSVEEGHHRRRLLRLLGIQAHENQAKRILNDIETYRQYHSQMEAMPEAVGAVRWLAERWEPVLALVPHDRQVEPAQFFHEVLDHCWFMSERQGSDVGMEVAAADYLRQRDESAIEATVESGNYFGEGA